MSQGVVAAGHPLTAEAGAAVLREGGNAVDAAVCAVLASFAVESPLTGFGAGGFMMVHDGRGETVADRLLRRRPGPRRDRARRRAGPGPGPLRRRDGADVLRRPGLLRGAGHRGRASSRRCERFGSVPLAELVEPGGPARPRGRAGQRRAGLHPRHPRRRSTPGSRARASSTRRRGGRCARATTFRFPELAEALERFGAEGAEPFYRGEVAAALGEFVRRARRHPRAAATWPPTRRSSGRRSASPSAAPRC